jgi:hypothetical protein
MRISLLAVLILGLMATALVTVAQMANPPYLSEFPSVDRVMREVKGADPRETALLQLATFSELIQLIRAMAGPREFRNMTVDESNLIVTYNKAHFQLAVDSDKAFPGPYGKTNRFSLSEMRPYDRTDPRFGVEGTNLFKRFFSASFRAEFERAVGADKAHHEAFVRAQEEADARAKANANASSSAMAPINWGALGNSFMGNEQGAVAVRRCIELGRSELECTGNGVATSLLDLVGANPNAAQSHVVPGLRVTGVFKAASGFSLTFYEASVSVKGCGKLVAQTQKYAVVQKGAQLVLQIASQPQQYILPLGADGMLAGPAAITMNGQVITGYTAQYVGETRATDGTVYPAHSAQVPIYAPRTEQCSIGSLSPSGPTTTVANATESVLGFLSGQSLDQANAAAAKNATPPGIRLAGQYAGQSGFRLEFHTDAVILDCGEAHVARSYTVQSAGNDQVSVTIQNGGVSVPLALQSNGSIAGAGSVAVSGRLITGTNTNGFVFAPRNATCAIGTLAPK